MFGFGKNRRSENEREKMARLEQAEGDVSSLRDRAVQVHQRLEDRRQRNHWREAIEQMIQGAH